MQDTVNCLPTAVRYTFKPIRGNIQFVPIKLLMPVRANNVLSSDPASNRDASLLEISDFRNFVQFIVYKRKGKCVFSGISGNFDQIHWHL